MDKNCQSSVESTVTTTSSSNSNSNNNHQNPSDLYLKHLNKISHKISKPPIRRTPIPPLHHHQQQQQQQLHHLHQPSQQQQQQSQQIQQQQTQQQNPQQQPPVYNINKSDFRDVVQKLTGSPAHDRFSTPPPIQPPKPQSSRLQRIRPPPLAHVSNRPPPPLTNTLFPPPPSSSTINNPINPNFNINPNHIGRSVSPLSPLPPFPSVHAAAESPISAYMRYLQSSTPTPLDSNSKGFPSPRWNNPNSFQQQQFLLPSPPVPMPPSSPFMMPNSPLGFGRISSPRSPYPLLSPSLLFSPTSGQLGFPQFPQSPRMPVGSPRWRGY